MNKLKILFIGILASFPLCLQAQLDYNASGYYQDALRFSSIQRGGSARIQGLAGSGVALGGDLSLVNANPATLGFFNKSVFTLTPQLLFRDNVGTLNGTENISFGDQFSVGHIGVSIDLTKSDFEKGDFRGGSLSFSYSKRNDFNEEIEILGNNFNNSISDFYLSQAQGQNAGNWYNQDGNAVNPLGLAYDVFLFDYDTAGCADPYDCDQFMRLNGFEAVNQRELIRTSGNQNEWAIAYGANFRDELYLGVKIGITNINYTFSRDFSESNLNSSSNGLQSVSINDQLEINGNGANISVGLIYRPVDVIRFGLSIESPTIYSLEENFEQSMATSYNNLFYGVDAANPSDSIFLGSFSGSLPSGFFDYTLMTPLRLNFGTAIFAGKSGFITLDAEYVDYRRSRISFESLEGNENADNANIRNIYDRALNLRAGGELRLQDFRLRAGYARFGDPFKDGINNVDQTRERISGGFGMRFQDYYWDVAVMHDWFNEAYTLYDSNTLEGPSGLIKRTITQFSATAGIYF